MAESRELRAGRPEEVGLLPERIARARQVAAEAAERGRTPSLVVLAARHGVIVLHEAFGKLRPGPDAPPLPLDAIFPVTSATKPITATLVMMLAEDGCLGVARPAAEYLPELRGEEIDQVLVHHLLTHTSGYDDEVLGDWTQKKIASAGMPAVPGSADPLQHVLFETRWDAPRVAPDREMIYCNHNYLLLGEIVRRVSGKPLEVFARERLFDPLGMRDTDYVVRDDMRARLLERPAEAPLSGPDPATGFPGMENELWRMSPNGAGGCYSTARDLAIFGQMTLSGGTYAGKRYLSPAVVETMTGNRIPGIGARIGTLVKREGSYGYGWIVDGHEKWRYFSGLAPVGSYSHTGAGGVSLYVDPRHGIVFVYLEVCLEVTENLEPVSWSMDLVQNVVTSAVQDACARGEAS